MLTKKEKRITRLIRVGNYSHKALTLISKKNKITISKVADFLLIQNPEISEIIRQFKMIERKRARKIRKEMGIS